MKLGSAALLALLLPACASGERRFPLREPIWRDTDLRSVSVPCRPDPTPEDPSHVACYPEPYVSPLAWDAADNTVFRPLAKVFAVDPAGEAVDVNSLDEVPDSSWWENRIGMHPMTVEEVGRGPCRVLLEDEGADGSWLIDQGKPDGASPGFRVKIEGKGKFMLKSDSKEQPERPSAASAIGVRLYYAAGFSIPCDAVVYFNPRLLKLKPGLKSRDNTGITKLFDEKALKAVLDFNVRRGDTIRMQSSEWLSGRVLGPFKYEGTRKDDPNDVIAHEDRREIRAAKLLAAWTNHFDAREQNTMTTWVADDPKKQDSSPGYVKHYYLDVSDCFGSEWDWDGISRRLGHSYYLDFQHVGEDFITLGLLDRPWNRARKSEVGTIFGYYTTTDFKPDVWQNGYPNPSFDRMSEADGAWMTRILARYGRDHIEAAVKAGKLSHPEHEKYLLDVVLGRHRLILQRYLSRLSPVTDVTVDNHKVCALDLAKQTGVFPGATFRYDARVFTGARFQAAGALPVDADSAGHLCTTLPASAPDDGAADDDASRYRIVDLTNGQAPGALRMHFYDLGVTRGLRLVGIERPKGAEAPH